MNPKLVALGYNIANFLLLRPVRLRHDAAAQLYFVEENGTRLYVPHHRRNWRYKRGIGPTIEKLAVNYNLPQVEIAPDDVFIDCGANAGELSIWAAARGAGYHAFEPDETAANACDLNAFDGAGKTNRKCLWHENTVLKFHNKTNTADSSVFEISEFDSVSEVPAITLDDYCKNHDVKKIKLLKVEAEGAEPEVLKGATRMLARTDFVSVDCSYERGTVQENTLAAVSTLLAEAGFRMTAARMKKRCTFLFANGATKLDS
ncbi:MAG: FkbM family methyltransferase [Hyphomicrobiales bacterium]